MAIQKAIPGEMQNSSGDLCVSDGTALFALCGELDVSNAEELREQFARDEVLSARVVRVDVTQVSFLDSVIIGLIVTACKRVRAAGSSFSMICDLQGIARSVFELDGLVEYLQVGEPSFNALMPNRQIVSDHQRHRHLQADCNPPSDHKGLSSA